MDLGLDKLIEMIEQKFGKWAATAVLFAVTAGAFGWGIHSLFAFLVIPVVSHGADIWAWVRPLTPKVIVETVLPGIIAAAIGIFLFFVGASLSFRRLRNDLMQNVSEVERGAQAVSAKLEEAEKKLKALTEGKNNATAQLSAVLQQVRQATAELAAKHPQAEPLPALAPPDKQAET